MPFYPIEFVLADDPDRWPIAGTFSDRFEAETRPELEVDGTASFPDRVVLYVRPVGTDVETLPLYGFLHSICDSGTSDPNAIAIVGELSLADYPLPNLTVVARADQLEVLSRSC